MHLNNTELCASLEQILTSGGDSRTALDEATGLNQFGCSPRPRSEALSYGSSTSSTISSAAYHFVEQEHSRLIGLAHRENLLDEQTERQRARLKQLLCLDLPGADVVFSASGTDSTLHALFLAKAFSGDRTIDNIVVASDETGSGSPFVSVGLHFSTVTAGGAFVTKGAPVAGLSDGVSLIKVPLRGPNAAARLPEDVDTEVYTSVVRSVAAGHHVLLQAMDSSKLGSRCPSEACLARIEEDFGRQVTIVIDACQMRLGRQRLCRQLAHGRLVLISGSKFFTGPSFSGALLVPAEMGRRCEVITEVPAGLLGYTWAGAWPIAWRGIRNALPESVEFGPYLRWSAAIEEIRAYYNIPEGFRTRAMESLDATVTEIFRDRSDHVELLPAPDLGDDPLDSEMASRTIFSFLVRWGERFATLEETQTIYRALNRDLSDSDMPGSDERALETAAAICHIGQPMGLVAPDGQQAGALRFCISARTVAEMWREFDVETPGLNVRRCVTDLTTVLDKTEMLARELKDAPTNRNFRGNYAGTTNAH